MRAQRASWRAQRASLLQGLDLKLAVGQLKKLVKINMVKPKTSKSTYRQPRKLKFGMQAYFNPTKRNMRKN